MTNSTSLLPDKKLNFLQQRTIAFAFVLICLGFVGSVGAKYSLRLKDVATASSMSEGQGKLKNFKTLRFTLYDAGILPRQARTTAGDVAITLVDQSGKSAGVIVERLNENQPISVGLIRRAEHQQRGREVITLQPGTYRVSMIDQPENNASLIVEP